MNSIISLSKESFLCSLFCLLSLSLSFAQGKKYYNPLAEQAIQGRLKILDQATDYGRLPQAVKSAVREPVWFLGTNSAGQYVEFTTDADSIQVRYKVKHALNMPHMPTIGVSGVDLYARKESSLAWEWAFGQYQFKDTVTYNFNNIGSDNKRTFRLYLPLYNTVDWLEIGISSNKQLQFVRKDSKPIIVYGTSIAQGACASRPGLAWTNILGRDFENEVINLAFSGNGRLEKPLLDLIVAEDASAFILDCIPNLAITRERSEAQLDSLIRHAVSMLRTKHPNTPIILAEHSSAGTPGFQNIHTMYEYGRSSHVAASTFRQLKESGVKNLYFVPAKAFSLDVNSTVDYAHPNDIGMIKIADTYRDVLQKILK